MDNIRLIDESLNPPDTPFYHVSIQANLNGLSFSVLDTRNLQYLLLKELFFGPDIPDYKYTDHLERAIMEDDLLQGNYKDIFCIWETERTTLLPAALYNKDNLKTFFEFNQPLNDLDELHADKLDQLDAYLVYPMHHEIANAFIRSYPRIRFFNQATPFLTYCLKANTDEGKKVFASFHDHFFDVAVFEGESLLLHNTFTGRSEKDILYYILHVYERLQLDTKETAIEISGRANRGSVMVETIQKYIKPVQFAPLNNLFQYSTKFEVIEAHRFINLFNLYSCGS